MKKQMMIFTFACAAAQCLVGADAKGAAGAPLSDAQRIPYHLGQTPSVPVMLKWKTIFVLPAAERILDVVCGFKDDWDVYAPKDSNFAMVTPLKGGTRTDLAFVTKSGNIYTFEIADVSAQKDAHAYTQVLVEAADDKMKAALNDAPKYYGADEVAAFRAQAQKAEKQSQELASKLDQQVEDAKAAARAQAQKNIHHDYHFDEVAAARDPWNVVSIWHDDKFSYVEASPSEQFAVYAVSDGKPTAVNIFPTGDGSFRTDRIVNSGYFKLGKKELKFSR